MPCVHRMRKSRQSQQVKPPMAAAVLGRVSCRGDGGVPLVFVQVAGAVRLDLGSGSAQGQVAAGEPVASLVVEDVLQSAGAGLVDHGGLVPGAGGPGPGAGAGGAPGGGAAGLGVGVAGGG